LTVTDFYALVGVALFVMGLSALILRSRDLQRILGLNIMGTGVFMVLVTSALGDGQAADPVPHAMVLTGIVVAVSATAFALALSLARERHK
jgi:multicomponent Na+:H+ antiporter subunit C